MVAGAPTGGHDALIGAIHVRGPRKNSWDRSTRCCGTGSGAGRIGVGGGVLPVDRAVAENGAPSAPVCTTTALGSFAERSPD